MGDPEVTAQPSMLPENMAPPADATPEEELEETEQEVAEETQEAEKETAAATAPPAPSPTSNEMKVLIAINGDAVMVGVKTPDTDPIFTKVEGGLAEALQQVPGLVEAAKTRWAINPRNPKAVVLEPPPAPARTVTPARKPVESPKPKAQPSFF